MHRFVPALLVLPLLASAGRAQAPTDLDKLVPSDALVHVVVDGIDPLKASVTDLMNAVMPGMGGMMIEGQIQQMMATPGLDQLETGKPITFSFLPSGATVFALPLKDPAKFQEGLTAFGKPMTSFIAGQGYSLLATEGTVTVDDLKKAGTAKPPTLQGPVRGFVNVNALYLKFKNELDGMLGMMSAMAAAQAGGQTVDLAKSLGDFAASVTRLDFALVPSKSGLEIATAFTPSQGTTGFIASVAASSPSTSNKMLGVIPSNSVIAFSGRMTQEMGAAYGDFLVNKSASSPLSDDDKAKIKSLMTKGMSLMAGDMALGMGGKDGGIEFTSAFTCSDAKQYREVMSAWFQNQALLSRLLAGSTPGMTMKTDPKTASETIDGVEVDVMMVSVSCSPDANAQTKMAVDMVNKLYSEGVRIAYPTGAAVMTMGPGGAARLKTALASIKSGSSSAPVAKSLPTGTTFSMAMDFAGMLKVFSAMAPPEMAGQMAMLSNLPPSKDYVTVGIGPKAGAAEFRLNLPASLFQSFMSMANGPR